MEGHSDGGSRDATQSQPRDAAHDSGKDVGALHDAPRGAPDASDARAVAVDARSDGPSDAAREGGFSCEGFTYCDGFESYEAGTIANGATLGPWAATVSRVAMTVDSVNPYSGKQSLHIKVAAIPDASAEGVLAQHASGGLVTGNDLYGRAMLYYSTTDAGGLPLGVHSWIFNASGTSTKDDGGVGMNLGGGGAKVQLNYHPPPPAVEESVVGGTMTTGVWHCVQWQYDGAGSPPANLANVWLDGTLAVGVDGGKGWEFATPWNAFDFGFTHYQTLKNSVEVFLDDFTLGPAMIPCP